MQVFIVTFRIAIGSPKQSVLVHAANAEEAKFKFLDMPRQKPWIDPEIISVTEKEAS